MTAAQAVQQRRFIHDAATGCVDEEGAFLHCAESAFIEHVARLRGERRMHRHEVCDREGFLECLTEMRIQFDQGRRIHPYEWVEPYQLHPKGFRAHTD